MGSHRMKSTKNAPNTIRKAIGLCEDESQRCASASKQHLSPHPRTPFSISTKLYNTKNIARSSIAAGTITVLHAAEACQDPPVCTAADAELCDIDPAPELDPTAVVWVAEDVICVTESPVEVVAVAVAEGAAPLLEGVFVLTSPSEAVYNV